LKIVARGDAMSNDPVDFIDSSVHPVRVLLIDDQKVMGQVLGAIISNEPDMAFYFCQDSKKALECAEQFSPTIILQDLIMPAMNGIDVVKTFRKHQTLYDLPIVVLSSEEKAESKVEAFSAGANDYIVKLPETTELLARIRYHSNAYIEHHKLNETIHQLEEAHQQLLQSEKMASIGQLAAGVAHEINNPIGFVGSNINSLKGYLNNIFELVNVYEQAETLLTADSEAREAIESFKKKVEWEYIKQDSLELMDECGDGISRVKQIVQDLKDFSRLDEAEWQWADMHKGINSTLNIVNNEIKYRADVIKEYGDLPSVECIPSQLNQVFMNLLVNAAHAIEGQGTIKIRTGAANIQGDLNHQKIDNPTWIWLQFIDTGKGMDSVTMSKIFDPFYTTKPVGQGTGLGLSLSYGIIKRHLGKIEVESQPGEGTTFTLWLPVQQQQGQATH
jgi:signal transduction histidine kinase